MTIEVALCERCGADWLWQSARRARHGLPGCPVCGSDQVSRCEREETPEELERIARALTGRRQPSR
jgi:hypothetical protein